MSNCTYRFTGPDGKEVIIVGMSEMKAYMAAHLDFFSAKGNLNFNSKQGLEVSIPEPAGANVAPADDLDAMFDEVLAEEVGAKQEKPKRSPVTVIFVLDMASEAIRHRLLGFEGAARPARARWAGSRSRAPPARPRPAPPRTPPPASATPSQRSANSSAETASCRPA